MGAVVGQPAFSQHAEGELAGAFGLVQTGDFVAEIVEPTADLLARSFEEGIVCASLIQADIDFQQLCERLPATVVAAFSRENYRVTRMGYKSIFEPRFLSEQVAYLQ